jgi:hypothetical protein
MVVLTLATLLGTLFALEAKAWLPRVSRRLVASAVARFPAELDAADRDRWSREIEADLGAFDDRPLGGFVFALRVRFKGGRDLAGELALAEKLAEPEEQPEAAPQSQEEDQSLSYGFVAGRVYLRRSSLRYGGIPTAGFVQWVRERKDAE